MGFLRNELRNMLIGIALFVGIASHAFAQAPAVAIAKSAQAFSSSEIELAARINLETIKEITAALSSDEMQGRGTMQPGGEKAAQYIADALAKIGAKPIGDKGTFFQKIDFKESVMTPETSFSVGGAPLKMENEYVVMPPYTGDESASGEMVFIAYGIMSDSIKRYDLKGVDLTGKFVVLLDGPPANISEDAWKKAHAQMAILQLLVARGVAGIITVNHGREKHPYEELATYMTRRQIALAGERGLPEFLPPFLAVGKSAAEKLFAKSGVSFQDALAQAERNDFRAFELKQKAQVKVKWKTTKGTSPNVVGYIEGSDPKLKEEAVLFSAHYDAFGSENGKIYHGAADNALGVAELLAVAEAYSKMSPRPKRSMLFLAVTGEEYGLYGSKYWAENPTWNIKKVAANLNLDGVGTEVYGPVKTFVGFGAEHSTLGTMLGEVSNGFGIKVISDPMPDEKIFYRSDHYSFVKRGVPALMLLGAPDGDSKIWIQRMKNWEKRDYHQPGDVIQKDWAWEGAKAVADVMGIMGLRISENGQIPSWLPESRFGKLERGNTDDIPEE